MNPEMDRIFCLTARRDWLPGACCDNRGRKSRQIRLNQRREGDRNLDNFAQNPKGNQNGRISNPHTKNKLSSENRKLRYFTPRNLVNAMRKIVTE